MDRKKVLDIYDRLIKACPRIERKGKTMPYTSANGHMFSQVNKDNQIGIRFSKEVQNNYFEKYNTGHFTSYGANMKGYVLMPEEVLNDMDALIDLLNEAYDYVMSLDSK